MLSEQEIIRREKLSKLREYGINPYPAALFEISTNTIKIISDFKENKSVSIVLIDQVPKSTKKSIDIQLIESSEAMFSKKNGKLRWNIELSPNQMVEKKFSFTVKHPSENKVSGF